MSILTTRMIALLNLASTLWERIDVSINRLVLTVAICLVVAAWLFNLLVWAILKECRQEKKLTPLLILIACTAASIMKHACNVLYVKDENGTTIALLMWIACLVPLLVFKWKQKKCAK